MTTHQLDTIHPATRMTDAPPFVRWHRPLLVVAAAMLLLAVVLAIARFVDPTEITGANGWDKPLKFALSFAIYCLTWSWLIGQLRGAHRTLTVAGHLIAVTSVIEVTIIVGAATAGVTSHYNVASPFATAMWTIMASSVTVLWLANLVVAIGVLRAPLGDAARTIALRSGAAISLVGLGLAFLMTGPTAEQLDDFQGIAGAHTVGVADGGPGIAILGWSTIGGDLRIPHFIGMHALQAIPLLLIALELASRRVVVLRDVRVRARLIVTAALGYSAAVALVTWQALRGQSIVAPDVLTLVAACVIIVGAVGAGAVIIVRAQGAKKPASTNSGTDF